MRPLCLASFIWHKDFKVHTCCSSIGTSIPFYDSIVFHSITIQHVFIHLSANGLLGYYKITLLGTFICKFLC